MTATIALQRATRTVSASGSVGNAWATYRTVRAEPVSHDLAEGSAEFGEAESATLLFRVRARAGVSTGDRLVYLNEPYNIIAIGLGRRDMQLKVTRITS